MSLHRNDVTNGYVVSRTWIAALRWFSLRGCLVLALLALCSATASALAEDDEPMTAEEIEARISELAANPNPTDAELQEMVELGQRYADLANQDTAPSSSPRTADRASTARRPAASTRRERAGAQVKQPEPTNPPRPATRPTTGTRGATRPGAKPAQPVQQPADPGEDVDVRMNIEAERFLLPYDERKYEFSMKDATYAQLIETFGRMASLPVIGTAPAGSVSFVSSDVMDFKTALGRVQMLLFNHPDQYWLWFKKDQKVLHIVRVTDITRLIPLDRIFTSVDAYHAANLDENEIALILYTPETGSIAELEPLRDFMPDYFRTAPYGGDKNAMTVFGLVQDIDKYLALIDIFKVGITDPRVTKVIPIDHVQPSAALEILKQLVDFGPGSSAGATPSRRRANQPSVAEVVEYGVTAIADDDRGSILVRAMPRKIEEIEEFLKFIDLPMEGEAHAPVVVRVEHADAGKVMELVKSILSADDSGGAAVVATKSAAARARAARRAKTSAARGGGATPTAAAPLQSESLTMLHWQAANSIILIGGDEDVAEARELIARFDVAHETETRFVDVEHRGAEEMCALATSVLTATRGGEEPQMTCTPESSDRRLILAGPTREISDAVALITKLDIDDGHGEETVHTTVLECMNPSDLVNLLNVWDSAVSAPAAPAPAGGKPAARARAARAARTVNSGRFQPDDANRALRVICTDADWEERYEPMITRLDRDACGDPNNVVLDVVHIKPEEAIASLTVFFGGKGGRNAAPAPTMLPVPRGVMVQGATPTELASMRQVLAVIDIDPEGLLERRTFELEHVEPAEIIPVLEALTGNGSPTSASPRSRRGRAAAAATAPAGTEVTFVEYGSRLWVSAPPQEMERIASLIEELDVAESLRELRPYDFEAGTNVTELAETLRQLFPGTARVTAGAAQPARRGRGRTARATAAPSSDDGILIIPQPSMRRIFVSAPVDAFAEIDEAIELIRPTIDDSGGVVVKFYPLEKAEPQYVAEIIEPIVQIRVDELVKAGELPEPIKGAGSLLRIAPDVSAKRLVVAAPSVLIAEIEELIAQVESSDQPGVVVRMVTLNYTSATDMAEWIGRMEGAGGSTPARSSPPSARGRRGDRGRGRGAAAAAAAVRAAGQSGTTTPSGVALVPMASDDALVVRGPEPAVEEVLEWINMLDTDRNRGRQMRVYQLVSADVEQVADTIMTVLDAGGGAKPATESDDPFLQMISMGGPRQGVEISLTTNYISNSMVVWASPRKLAEIEAYINEIEESTILTIETLPSKELELKYADPYDATYELEEFIDAIWSSDKPKVDYIPFTSVLIMKSRYPDKDFPRLEEIIAKHIDVPGKTQGRIVKRESIKGAPASEVVAEALRRLGDEYEIEVEGLEVDRPSGLLPVLLPEQVNRELAPCVLPGALVRAMDALATTAVGQPAEDEPAPSPTPDSVGRAIQEALQQKEAEKAQATAQPEEAAPVRSEEPTRGDTPSEEAAPVEKPKLKIRINPIDNSISIEGMSRDVNDVRELIQDIAEDRGEDAAEEIRVWQLEHVDPNVATQVLESMFGASSPRTRAAQAVQQLRAQQLAAAQARAAAQQRGGRQQPGAQPQDGEQVKGGEADERGGRGGDRRREGEEQPAAPQPEAGISVFPYPPLHAIIVKAPAEMFPKIERLVATIDRRTTGEAADFAFFTVHNQAASAVEEQLKVIFKIDQPQPGARGAAARRGRGQPNQATQQIEQLMESQLDLAGLGEEAGALGTTSSITITSNDATNTVLVRGPKPVLELAEEIIKEIELNAPPPLETRTYPLEHADATTLVPQLKELFAIAKDSGYHPDNVQATFLADRLNNALIVKARETDFERIEAVIAKFDAPAGPPDEAVTLSIACGDAEKFAALLGKIYGMGRRGQESAKKIEFVGDAGSNTIVFSAPEDVREEISARVATMDQTACDLAEPRFVSLTSASASQVAKVIEQAFGGGRGGNGRVRVAGDDATKKLIVTSPDGMFPKIEQFAKTLDVPASNLDVKTYTLKFAKPSETLQQMEKVFRELAMQLKGQGINVDAFAGTASDRAKSITVAGGPITFAAVEKFLADVDVEAGDTTISSMVVALKKTDAREVADMIRRLFPRPENGIDPPRVEANPRTNTLVVFGTTGQLDRIKKDVVDKVEELAESPQERENRVFTVNYTDLNDVRNAITSAFRLEHGAHDSERVDVAIENATRSVVVTGKPEKLDKVGELITQLDVPTTFKPGTRTFKLEHADAGSTREAIVQIYGPRGNRRQSPSEEVTAVVDWGSNSVIVSTGEARMTEIATFIESLDQSGQGARQVHVVTLEHADAAGAVRSLQEMFAQRGGPRGQETVGISNPPGSDALLIRANDKEFAEISAVIETLDVLPGDEHRAARMFTLKYTNADEMQSILEDYLSRPGSNRGGGRGARGGELMGDVRITTMPSSNSIVATGNAEQLERVAALVARIDVQVEDAGNAPKIIHLEKAIASDIEPILTQMFIEGGGSRPRGGGRAGNGAQMTPVIVANDAANTLIVRASPTDFTSIQELVHSLDQEETDLGARFKIVQVASAFRVGDLADTIEQTVQQASARAGDTGRGPRGGRAQGQFTAQPIEASNSLVLAGDPKQIQVAVAMLDQIQAQGPAGGKVTKIIPLGGNRDPEEIKRVIEEMINNNKSQGTSGRGVRGRRR